MPDTGDGLSVLRLETDGRAASAKVRTVAIPMTSANVREHIIASSKNISLSTTNGVGRSVRSKVNIVADPRGKAAGGTLECSIISRRRVSECCGGICSYNNQPHHVWSNHMAPHRFLNAEDSGGLPSEPAEEIYDSLEMKFGITSPGANE